MCATRRTFLTVFALLLLLSFSLSRRVAAQTNTPKPFTLTILHTNDLHGHLFPFAYTEMGRGKGEKPSVGGAARRATLIRALRCEIKNPVLLVDSGDTFTRGPLTNAYEGLADVEAMNALGYDLAALGNNEFKAKDGVEDHDATGAQNALLQIVKRSHFHWLCANARDSKGAFLEGVLPYAVREVNGVRVGFLGLTPPRVATYPQVVSWTITDPIVAAKEWIPEVRKHCDILIALTHLGVELDKQLAAQTTGLDAIVGGDSHTFLYKALEVANPEGTKIPIVQDGEFGVNLGRFDLHFRSAEKGQWKLADYNYKLIPVNASLREASDVSQVLDPYLRPLLTVVGHLGKIGDTPQERNQITNHLIVNALRQQTGADYAVNPGDSGFEVFRHQTVTRYDVYAILPFRNHVVTAILTGSEIQAMRKAVSTTFLAGDATHIEPSQTYKAAFVDYAAKTAYKLLTQKLTDTGCDVREMILAYLGQKQAQAIKASSTVHRTQRLARTQVQSVRTNPSDLPNFHAVAPGIYRGGAPTAAGLQLLRTRGIHTIVDLRISPRLVRQEKARASQLGLRWINLPMGSDPPTRQQVAILLSTLAHAPQEPVFVHCQHGADRTGCMIGLWRVTQQGWTFSQAWAEMRHDGFDSRWQALTQAVRQRAKQAGKSLSTRESL